jgi:cellulose synthase/poly-beta-1,6-N-acetylglucosamine synthase-like glycosyltransferase
MAGVSVIVASFRRPDRLAACLEGLRAQTRPAEEIVVIVHASDPVTADRVAEHSADMPNVRCVVSAGDGSVAAYNTGLVVARQPLVAYVDDDAVPSPEWLARIVDTFDSDEEIAGVGGRDIVLENGHALQLRRRIGSVAAPRTVGRIQWFGRMISNHHIGEGPARDVDVLKGVNMAFRREAVASHGFDPRLIGQGAVVHSELSICLPLRKRGLRIVYDPEIVVTHYPATRPAGDHRSRFDAVVVTAAAHNEALQILDYFPPQRRAIFAAWGALIGTTHAPGLAVTIRDAASRRGTAWRRLVAAQRGRSAAWTTRRTPRAEMTTGAVGHAGSQWDPIVEADAMPVLPKGTTNV